ncbi:MAG: hypothetical protein AAFR94_06375 [Pseudomonadota bacterium]
MPGLIQQFWKRKVVQFGALYLGAAWLVFQVAIAVESTLDLPDWLDQSVLVVLVLCFPLALILAWAQDSRASPKLNDKQLTSQNEPTSSSDEPSIVVLPFRHRNDDEIQ